jgi:hypothetical protein
MAQGTGSIAVGIPCSGTNASVVGNLTCSSGNEVPGVTFVMPTAGDVEACWGANWYNASGTGTAVSFQLVETANNGNTAIQRPSALSYQGLGTATQTEFNIYDIGNCSQFSFESAGQKTLKLFGTSTVGSLLLDGGTAADAARKFWITVRPLTQNIPAPLLVGSVTSNSAGSERVERALLLNNGSNCTISAQSGTWLSSCTRNGLGDITATIAAGIFSAAPICTPALASGSSFTTIRTATVTSTSVQVQSSGSDTNVNLICMGPR